MARGGTARKGERQINVRMTRNMIRAIDLAVRIGAANNRSDFIRAAISEKLQDLGIFQRILGEIDDDLLPSPPGSGGKAKPSQDS